MDRWWLSRPARIGVAALLSLGLATVPASGAGFGIFEQGTKAMGMAGAFTAQADDASALFHNAGGIAFFEQREIAVGTTLIQNDTASFQGQAPFPGPTATGDMKKATFFIPHAYYVRPLGPTWSFGLGVNAPFGLTTEWDNQDTFAGRYLSTRAELRTVDLNPTLGWRATPRLGIGVGLVGRFSDVQLDRRVPFVNPITNRVQDIASVRLESDLESGFGWNAGLLWKTTDRLSLGLSYRSKIEIDYGGEGTFTQISTGIPALDATVAAGIPFGTGLPIETSVEFPDMASLGIAYVLTPRLLVETDVNWTGWSSFDEVDITFTQNPAFSSHLIQRYEDVYNYRLGIRWDASTSGQWRFGYVYDETPQPEPTVSPLLPDNDRNGYTIGYGWQGSFDFDVALMYIDFGTRTRDESFADEPIDFFGTYETKAFLLGLTLGF